jgi:hypothetical protein
MMVAGKREAVPAAKGERLLCQRTFAGASSNDEDAPKAVHPANVRILVGTSVRLSGIDLRVGRSTERITRFRPERSIGVGRTQAEKKPMKIGGDS